MLNKSIIQCSLVGVTISPPSLDLDGGLSTFAIFKEVSKIAFFGAIRLPVFL